MGSDGFRSGSLGSVLGFRRGVVAIMRRVPNGFAQVPTCAMQRTLVFPLRGAGKEGDGLQISFRSVLSWLKRGTCIIAETGRHPSSDKNVLIPTAARIPPHCPAE